MRSVEVERQAPALGDLVRFWAHSDHKAHARRRRLYALSEDRALEAQAREPFGFARAIVERA